MQMPPGPDEVYPTPTAAEAERVLQSSLFRALPTDQWGPLHRTAYLRRLADELTVAADMLDTFAKAGQ